MKTVRTFEGTSNRYEFDSGFCSISNGFAQVDTSQDAAYFGTWANPLTRSIVTFCEGDVTVLTDLTASEFKQELEILQKWNIDNGHRFCGIDCGYWNANEKHMEIRQAFITLGVGHLLHKPVRHEPVADL